FEAIGEDRDLLHLHGGLPLSLSSTLSPAFFPARSPTCGRHPINESALRDARCSESALACARGSDPPAARRVCAWRFHPHVRRNGGISRIMPAHTGVSLP